jgi:DnaJ family protein C protein 28
MDKLQRLVEEKIQKAFDEGAFDNLPGKGEPLKLDDENPFEDPTLRMGHRLLRNNGFTLPWIQEQKEIAQEAERLRAELARAWERAERARVARLDRWQAELRWRKAVTAFRQQVADLNERIRRYNFQAPSARFQRLPLDADRELERIARPLTLAEMGLSDQGAPSEPPQTGARKERRSLLLRVRALWQTLRAWLARPFLLRARRAELAHSYN